MPVDAEAVDDTVRIQQRLVKDDVRIMDPTLVEGVYRAAHPVGYPFSLKASDPFRRIEQHLLVVGKFLLLIVVLVQLLL